MIDVCNDFDFDGFWSDNDYARRSYHAPPPTDDQVAAVQQILGYTLPASYVMLARKQNGGLPARDAHPMSERTSWTAGHVALNGIFSISADKRYSLCGEAGSRFWFDHWGYPAISMYFADCPSAGHDIFCLDFRSAGPTGNRRSSTSTRSATTPSRRSPPASWLSSGG